MADKAAIAPPLEIVIDYTDEYEAMYHSYFWMNAFSEVGIVIGMKKKTGAISTDSPIITTLPEGFRPQKTVNIPGLMFATESSQPFRQIASITIDVAGNIRVHLNNAASHCVFSGIFLAP